MHPIQKFVQTVLKSDLDRDWIQDVTEEETGEYFFSDTYGIQSPLFFRVRDGEVSDCIHIDENEMRVLFPTPEVRPWKDQDMDLSKAFKQCFDYVNTRPA